MRARDVPCADDRVRRRSVHSAASGPACPSATCSDMVVRHRRARRRGRAAQAGRHPRGAGCSRPLQLHYFNENLAGEGFFHRLEYVLADPRATGRAARLLPVPAASGSRASIAVRGGELELAAVQRRVQDIARHRLAPRAAVAEAPAAARAAEPRRSSTTSPCGSACSRSCSRSRSSSCCGVALDRQTSAHPRAHRSARLPQ